MTVKNIKNMHSQTVPNDILKQANQKVDELMEMLSPYLVSLTAEERMSMLKIGEKSLSFVEKAGELARNNPALCPPFFNMDEFDTDLTDALALRGLLNKVHQLNYGVDDTMMIAGGEAYNAALVFYSSVKMAVAQNISGAKAVLEELKKRFPGKGKAKATEEKK